MWRNDRIAGFGRNRGNQVYHDNYFEMLTRYTTEDMRKLILELREHFLQDIQLQILTCRKYLNPRDPKKLPRKRGDSSTEHINTDVLKSERPRCSHKDSDKM